MFMLMLFFCRTYIEYHNINIRIAQSHWRECQNIRYLFIMNICLYLSKTHRDVRLPKKQDSPLHSNEWFYMLTFFLTWWRWWCWWRSCYRWWRRRRRRWWWWLTMLMFMWWWRPWWWWWWWWWLWWRWSPPTYNMIVRMTLYGCQMQHHFCDKTKPLIIKKPKGYRPAKFTGITFVWLRLRPCACYTVVTFGSAYQLLIGWRLIDSKSPRTIILTKDR